MAAHGLQLLHSLIPVHLSSVCGAASRPVPVSHSRGRADDCPHVQFHNRRSEVHLRNDEKEEVWNGVQLLVWIKARWRRLWRCAAGLSIRFRLGGLSSPISATRIEEKVANPCGGGKDISTETGDDSNVSVRRKSGNKEAAFMFESPTSYLI